MKSKSKNISSTIHFLVSTLTLLCLMSSFAWAEDLHCGKGTIFTMYPRSTKQCVPGRHTAALECCQKEKEVLEEHRAIKCESPDDCVEIIAEYDTCGGIIGSFASDDNDNIYFWAGNWTLHSLDSSGQLRWRYEICAPIQDVFCNKKEGANEVECDEQLSVNPAMSVDYWGNLLFFIGDVFYALSPNGELIVRKRIQIPEPYALNHLHRVAIANGLRRPYFNVPGARLGHPILRTDGTIVAQYTYYPNPEQGEPFDEQYSGWLHISRSGKVLRHIPLQIEGLSNPIFFGVSTVGLSDDVYSTFAQLASFTIERTRLEGSFVSRIQGQKHEQFLQASPKDECSPSSSECSSKSISWSSSPAVDSQKRVYGLTRDGHLYGFDPKKEELKQLLVLPKTAFLYAYNRPVFDTEDILYLVRDGDRFAPGFPGTQTWALDVGRLWTKPITKAKDSLNAYLQEDSVLFIYSGNGAGGWSTPLVGDNKRLYTSAGGLHALSTRTGEWIWTVGHSSLATSPLMLSNGNIVFNQTTSARLWVVRETNKSKRGSGPAHSWSRTYADKYHSNNYNHPKRWDRQKEPPYPNFSKNIEEIDRSRYVKKPFRAMPSTDMTPDLISSLDTKTEGDISMLEMHPTMEVPPTKDMEQPKIPDKPIRSTCLCSLVPTTNDQKQNHILFCFWVLAVVLIRRRL